MSFFMSLIDVCDKAVRSAFHRLGEVFSPRGVAVCCVLLCMTATLLYGQGFTVTGTAPEGVTGMAELTLYPAGGRPQVMKNRVRKGSFTFQGMVKEPTVAMLRIGTDAPLYMWLENSVISFSYNKDMPSSSRVNGSRSNSEYRYALEQCTQEAVGLGGGAYLSQALARYAEKNLASRYVPFLLWLYYQDGDSAELDTLCHHMAGDAVKAYHYPLLQRKIKAMSASREGCVVPSVVIPTERGRQVPLDSLRQNSYTFLLISPSWLEKERHQADSLRAAIKGSGRKAQVVWAVQDKGAEGWDALYMQQLDVQRLPYIILLGPDGKILARDVRVWEAERLLCDVPEQQPANKNVPAATTGQTKKEKSTTAVSPQKDKAGKQSVPVVAVPAAKVPAAGKQADTIKTSPSVKPAK